jgi:hypothetical protein
VNRELKVMEIARLAFSPFVRFSCTFCGTVLCLCQYGSDLSRSVDPRGLESTSGWNFIPGWGSGIVIQSRLLQR